MNPKELTVSVSRKVGTPNFGSKGFGLSATVGLAESDDLIKVKQELTNKLNQMLDFEIRKIKQEGSRK